LPKNIFLNTSQSKYYIINKMNTKLYSILLAAFLFVGNLSFSQQVIDPNDPLVEYDVNNPPTQPTWGNVGKWVRTKALSSWSDSYKAYIYKGMPFRVLFPAGYDTTGATTYPLVIHLHGRGEKGSSIYDNENSMRHAGYKHYLAANNGSFNGLTLIPQNGSGFFNSANFTFLAELIEDHFAAYLHVDENRITIHGLSAGGSGTWNMTLEHPKVIAAALPMSAASTNFISQLNTIREIPIWLSQGGKDKSPAPATSQQVYNAAVNLGMDFTYTVYANLGHGVWSTHYNESDFFPYLMRANKVNPVVYFEKTEFCPSETIQVTMGVTAGFTAYEWRKDGVLIPGATSHTLSVTQLGIYDVRIKRGNNWSYWSPVPVEVKMKAPTVTPPIEKVGLASIALPSPDNATGVELTVPGEFEEYEWKLSGSSTVLSTDAIFNATTPGDYVVSVTEKFGCSSSNSPVLTVLNANASNGPPAPVTPAVFTVSKTALKLTWTEQPSPAYNETGFEIYRSESQNGPYEMIAITTSDTTSFVDEGLISNTTYHYVMRAINGNAASATTAAFNGKTEADVSAPTAPLNLKVVRTTNNTVTLIWNASTDDAGIDKYEIYKGTYKAAVTGDTTAIVYNLTENQVYNFTVKARDHANNLSPASNQVTAAATFSGLNYSYYHGSFSVLPDFNTLTPITTGTMPNVDISSATQADNFAFMWDGYIDIPVAGNYTFETRSDDGSKVYIGGYDPANEVVDNDGLHGNRYREGTYNFPTAGAYPITITFFERTGGANMQLYWKNTAHGIGSSRQLIPDEAFGSSFVMPCCAPTAPSNLAAAGVAYNRIDVSWSDSSNNETGFQIYRSTNSGQNYTPIGIVNQNVTSYVDTIGLTANTTYYYQVVALGQYGASHSASGLTEAIGVINYGVAAQDGASGTGFIMYSDADVFARFSANKPLSTNSEHLIAVRYNAGQWQYDNNSNYYNFTPVASDLLLAAVDFSNDNITSFEGIQGVENGIEKGFASGDLTFNANLWNGSFNNGEFTVGGTYFNRYSENLADATTLALPTTPVAATALTATATSTTSVELKWDDNSNNEQSFTVYRSLNNNQSYLPIATLGANTTDTVVYTDTVGLYANSFYYYMVAVSNAGGTDTSNEVTETTLNTPPVLTATGNVMMRHDFVENVQLFAYDMDGDSVFFSTSNMPTFATLSDYGDGTALLQFSPSANDTATYSELVVNVTDNFGGMHTDTFTLTVTDNFIPTLDSITDFNLDEGTTLSTLLTAYDSNGVGTLTWDTTELPSFAKLTPYPNGTALLELLPLYADGGSYLGMNVIVQDDRGAKANRRFDITVNEVNPNQTVKVNYKHATTAGSPWNDITSVAAVALNNTNGLPSGISVELLTSSWKTYNEGKTTGDNSGVVPDNVLKEYYYFGIFGAPNTVDLKLTGLDPIKDYNLSFVASSKWTGTPDNGTTVYTCNGQSSSVYTQNNTSNTANLVGLQSNAQGELIVTMSKAAGTPLGYINAFVLEDIYNYGATPDPARNVAATFQNNSVLVEWYDAPYNETGYNVYRSDSVNGTFTLVNAQPLPANTISFVDANVIENNFYYYKLKAVNAAGASAFSNTASVFINNTAPALSVSGDSVVTADSTAVLTILATDPPNNLITLSATGLPSFATFNDAGNGNGSITFTPGVSDIGEYTVTIEAVDENNASSTRDVLITVPENVLYSVYVNFNQYPNAAGSAPWNNTNKAPQQNDVFNNLYDNNNVQTGIDLQLMTGFGGAYNQGAQTGNNSGIVPDNVLKEYYWFGIFGAPNQTQLKVSGLDNTKKYNFKFLGSSTFSGSGISDNGETNYTIGAKMVAVDVQGNTSNMGTIKEVVANSNGEVFIDITKGAGASIGYLNAMIIEVVPGEAAAFDPTDLTATATSGTTIDLNWSDNSFDETGFDIQRSLTGNEIDFVSIATTAANAVSFTDATVHKDTVYYYRARALRSTSNSAYTNVAYTGTIAFSVYINVNGDATYDAPAPWNNLSITANDNDVFTGFLSDNGNPTGYEMIWEKAMQGSNDWGTSTGNNSGVVLDTVLRSFFFNDAFDPAAEIKMTGLSQEYTYNFKFIGSIATNYNIQTNFTIGNETVTNNQSNNTTEMAAINNVVSDNNNEIDFRVQEANGSNWAIFNGVIIEAVTAPAPAYSKGKATAERKDGIEVRYGQSNPSITLYPNPMVNQDVTLAYTDASLGQIQVMVTDITGRTIAINEYSNTQLNGSLNIDLSNENLNNGMYIVRVQFPDGQVKTTRLVKF
jgi:predicted esterase